MYSNMYCVLFIKTRKPRLKSKQELKVCGYSLDLPDWLRGMAGMKSSVALPAEESQLL